MLKSSAQSTIDYLILTGIILIVVLPLLMFSNQRLDATRESQITDAVNIVENAVTELINLGYGSATERVVQIPSGIEYSLIEDNNLILGFKGRELIYQFAYNIAGIFPINPGRHYIKLFNNGTYIIFSICGNNIIEDPEQCDGTATPFGFECYPPGSPNACKLKCISTINCPFGYECVNDVCTLLGFCGNGIPENFEQCDPPSSTPVEQCDSFISIPGMGICTTIGGIPCQCQNTCGNNVVNSPWEVCDPTASPTGCAPGETCINCQQCIGGPPPPSCGGVAGSCSGTCPGSSELCLFVSASGSCQCTSDCSVPGYSCPVGTVCNIINGECNTIPTPPPTCPNSIMAYWNFSGPITATTIYDTISGYVGNLLGGAQIMSSVTPIGNFVYVQNTDTVDTDKVYFPSFNLPDIGTLEMLILPSTWSLSKLNIFVDTPNPLLPFTCLTISRDPSNEKITTSPAYGNIASLNSLSEDNFYHIAFAWNTNIPTFELYINGVPQGSSGSSIVPNPDCSQPFYVGGLHTPTLIPLPSTGFNGIIDEIMVFNQMLNPSTIQQHAYSGLAQQPLCTSTPALPPCSSTFPACGGACAAGQTCVNTGSSCSCVTPCSSSSAPTCGGYCPPSQTCMDIGGSCQCGIPATCGDGTVNQPSEQCDCDSSTGICDWGSASITNPNAGCWQGQYCISPGQPNPCTCTFTNTGSPQCTASCPVGTCGDGVIGNTPGEECDGGGCGAGEICLNCICIPDPGGGVGTGGTVG